MLEIRPYRRTGRGGGWGKRRHDLQNLFQVLRRKLTTGGSMGLEKQPWFLPHI